MQTGQQITMMPAMNLAPEDWNSLYLKVLPVDLTFNGNTIDNEENLMQLIECGLGLGKVSRIDFTERKGSNGHTQRSAYIHFYLWNAINGAQARKIIDEQGSITFNGLVNPDGTVLPFMGKWFNGVTNKRFLKFKKNINPVSLTKIEDMNREQLMNNYNKLLEHQKTMEARLNDFVKKERQELINLIEEAKSNNCDAGLHTPIRKDKDDLMTLDELDYISVEDGEVADFMKDGAGSPAYREAEMTMENFAPITPM